METVETALEVPTVLDDNLEVVDDIESNNKEGVRVQGSVEDLDKIDKASAAPDKDAALTCTNLEEGTTLTTKIYGEGGNLYPSSCVF